MVTAKLDLIMKKLDIEKKEVMHINDSHMTYKECEDYPHSAVGCSTIQEDVNFINNNTYYRPQQNQGCNQQPRQGNYKGNNQGNNFNNKFLPLRELVASQSKLLDQMTMKLTSNDKTLENIHARRDTFAFAIKNQHSFNKIRITISTISCFCSSIRKRQDPRPTRRFRNC